MSIDELMDLIEHGDATAVSAAVRAEPYLARAKSQDGDTALHVACWQKQNAIVGTLLAYDPDVNARGAYGRTPLHYAVHEGTAGSAAIVAALLNAGANPDLRDDLGFTVEDWAKTEMDEGLAAVLDVLRRHRARARP